MEIDFQIGIAALCMDGIAVGWVIGVHTHFLFPCVGDAVAIGIGMGRQALLLRPRAPVLGSFACRLVIFLRVYNAGQVGLAFFVE